MKKSTFLFSLLVIAFNSYSQTTSTLAGNGTYGFQNGTGASARFGFPMGIFKSSTGDMFVADYSNHSIRQVTTAGVVTTPVFSQFMYPKAVVKDGAGNYYVILQNDYKIYKFDGTTLSTFAGGSQGYLDGTGTGSMFYQLEALAIDGSGNIYACDGNRIRKISPARVVTTVAGSSMSGDLDGPVATALLYNPSGIAIDAGNNLYVSDRLNHKIKKISSGQVVTLAGSTVGFSDGSATQAKFKYPQGLNVGVDGVVYVCDRDNHSIRKIAVDGTVTTLVGNGATGNVNGTGSEARFYYPNDVVLDDQQNLYISDGQNNQIRKVSQTLAVHDFELKRKLTLYPIPVTNVVNISNSENLRLLNYSVIDSNGRVLERKILEGKSVIDLSIMAKGVYVLELETEKGILSKKIIKE